MGLEITREEGRLPKVAVKVRRQHVNEGIPRDCFLCPVALALKDAIPAAERITVARDRAEIAMPDGAVVRLCTTPETSVWIQVFDCYEQLEETIAHSDFFRAEFYWFHDDEKPQNHDILDSFMEGD